MLPEAFDPRLAARSGERFRGSVSLRRLPRLAELLIDPEGEAAVEIVVSRGEANRPVIRGAVAASVKLECQRCLQPAALELAADVELTVVGSDAEAAEQETEALVCQEGERVSVATLVEDELILALPVVALHPPGPACSVAAEYSEEAPEGAQSPFAVLRELTPRR